MEFECIIVQKISPPATSPVSSLYSSPDSNLLALPPSMNMSYVPKILLLAPVHLPCFRPCRRKRIKVSLRPQRRRLGLHRLIPLLRCMLPQWTTSHPTAAACTNFSRDRGVFVARPPLNWPATPHIASDRPPMLPPASSKSMAIVDDQCRTCAITGRVALRLRRLPLLRCMHPEKFDVSFIPIAFAKSSVPSVESTGRLGHRKN